MINTCLRVFIICVVAVMAVPLVANAHVLYSEDFDIYMAGTTSGPGWTSTSNGQCNGATGSGGFDMYTPTAMMGTCVELVVGPVNVEDFNDIQVSGQWQNNSPAAPGYELEFEFVWTGPSAGTSSIVLNQAAIIANSSLETVSSGAAIPDDATTVTLYIRSVQEVNDSSILIDNILFESIYPIPAMTKWGMLGLAALMGLFILYYLRRIRKVSYSDN